jgi:HEAT repeat protein
MSHIDQIREILSKISGRTYFGDPNDSTEYERERAYQADLEYSRELAGDKLTLLGAGVIDDMLSVFKTTPHQSAILHALIKIGDAKAINALETLSEDATLGTAIRKAINSHLDVLKLIGAVTIDDMLSVFKTTPNQYAVLRALAKIGDAKAINALETLSEDATLGTAIRKAINFHLRDLKKRLARDAKSKA